VQVTRLLLASLLVVLVISGLSARQQPGSRVSQTGVLRGLVMDSMEAAIPNALVRIESDTEKRPAVTDELGNYEMTLPAGNYRLRLEAPGFCTGRTATFRLPPAKATFLNLVLQPCPSHGGGPTHESLPLHGKPEAPPELLVRYCQRDGQENVIEYRCRGGLDVLASYGTTILQAWNLQFNVLTRKLLAQGFVEIYEGNRRIQALRAEVDLGGSPPRTVLEKDPVVMRKVWAAWGRGRIDGESASFHLNFKSGKVPGSLLYEDPKKNIECLVKDIPSATLIDSETKKVRLEGSCEIAGSRMNVVVVVEDKGFLEEDAFSIVIGESFYTRSGVLSSGVLQVELR